MSLIRGMRIINNLEYGALTASTLNTLLTGSAVARAEFAAALHIRGNFRRLLASAVATAIVTGSATAMSIIMSSKLLREHLFSLLDNAADAATLASTLLSTYSAALSATPESVALVVGSAHARRALWAGSDSILTPFTTTLAINAMRESAMSRIIPVALASANVAVRANTPSDGIMFGWSINSTGILSTTSRVAGSSLGAITAASGTVTGTKAEFDNVVKLQYNSASHPMFASSVAGRTGYIGFLPTPAP